MGVIMSFTRVSAVELERLAATAEWPDDFLDGLEIHDGGPSGYLDKAWAGLAYLLAQANIGVDLVDTGRPLADDNYFAWHPDDVSATAKVLSRIPFDELALFFDPAAMDAAGCTRTSGSATARAGCTTCATTTTAWSRCSGTRPSADPVSSSTSADRHTRKPAPT